MLRLLQIEYYKLKNTKYFWVLLICFAIFLLAVPIGSKILIDFIISKGEGENFIGRIDLSELPLFDFLDIWQNLTYIYKSFSIFLGFLFVISICNEYSYGTIKQNVIDGLSRREFIMSKILMIIALSIVSGIAIFIIGLIMGALWSPVKNIEFIFENIIFIPGYILSVAGFLLFCLFIGLLLKRSGLVLALLIFYVYMLENISYLVLKYHYKFDALADLLPVRAIGNIIRNPYQKYMLQETQTYISLSDLGIASLYIAIIVFFIFRIIDKRDLA